MAEAAVVRLVEETVGQYRLEGEDLVDVASIDLTLDYDQEGSTIADVTKGDLLQEMLFASNLTQPGVLRIGVVGTQTVNGSGTLALLTGDSQSRSPQFKKLVVRLNNAKGENLDVMTYLSASVESPDIPGQMEAPTTNNRFGGTISGLTSGSAGAADSVNVSDNYATEASASTNNAVGGMRMTFVELREFAASSPYKRMKSYKGARTYRAMAEMFVRSDQTIRQHPYPAFSDGQTEIEIVLPALHHELPSLALSNAKLISSGISDNGEWVIRCLPFKDELSAKVLVLGLEQLVEIPVVIAPAVDIEFYPLDPDEIIPKYNLTHDGGHAWDDDYLMVNLLVRDSEKL